MSNFVLIELTPLEACWQVDFMNHKLPQPESIGLTDPLVIESHRRMTPAEKIAQVFALNRGIRQRLASGLAIQHPEWSVAQVQQELLGECPLEQNNLLRGTVEFLERQGSCLSAR